MYLLRGPTNQIIIGINMQKQPIHTEKAPQAIGTYSQAIVANGFLFLSGQIPLDPITMNLVTGDITVQAEQVFHNMQAVLEAAGASLQQVVKLTVYLTDLSDFTVINTVMAKWFKQPYPARAVLQVSALPKGAKLEIDAIAMISIS